MDNGNIGMCLFPYTLSNIGLDVHNTYLLQWALILTELTGGCTAPPAGGPRGRREWYLAVWLQKCDQRYEHYS